MSPQTLLVTVGSTLFVSLTETILSPSILSILPGLGIRKVVVQYGAADLLALTQIEDLEVDAHGRGQFVWRDYNGLGEVAVQVLKYTDDFTGLVASADAIISHAGSGSILTSLRSGPKPLLVVPNTSLMDNHQAELAVELEKQGYLTVSTVEALPDTIGAWLARGHLKPFPALEVDRFRSVMDGLMGFAS
ncbi:glycosyl transferase [Papiliotrema laurentii]|uniref:UDP-N-acetylglucosamine transferase subunit ALG13 n=1 Tax=Papiliotrema laurentii TaxID=5418 RepID=A0AAD9FS33_PAPLA|nr:glycosyl transferase [Papiliotrema laurentii]